MVHPTPRGLCRLLLKFGGRAWESRFYPASQGSKDHTLSIEGLENLNSDPQLCCEPSVGAYPLCSLLLSGSLSFFPWSRAALPSIWNILQRIKHKSKVVIFCTLVGKPQAPAGGGEISSQSSWSPAAGAGVGERGWSRVLAQNVARGGCRWRGPGGAMGEVLVHHRNGPFAMIGCPGVNNANGIGRVNSVTRLNRRNMQSSARVSINQPCAALRGRQDLKFRSGDGYSHNPRWRGNLFCLYLFTARQGLGAGALHSHSAF